MNDVDTTENESPLNENCISIEVSFEFNDDVSIFLQSTAQEFCGIYFHRFQNEDGNTTMVFLFDELSDATEFSEILSTYVPFTVILKN